MNQLENIRKIDVGKMIQVSTKNVYEQKKKEFTKEELETWNTLITKDYQLEECEFNMKDADWLISLWDIDEDEECVFRTDKNKKVYYEYYDGDIDENYLVKNEDIVNFVHTLIQKAS